MKDSITERLPIPLATAPEEEFTLLHATPVEKPVPTDPSITLAREMRKAYRYLIAATVIIALALSLLLTIAILAIFGGANKVLIFTVFFLLLAIVALVVGGRPDKVGELVRHWPFRW